MIRYEGRDPRRKTPRPVGMTKHDEKYRDSTQPIEGGNIPSFVGNRRHCHCVLLEEREKLRGTASECQVL